MALYKRWCSSSGARCISASVSEVIKIIGSRRRFRSSINEQMPIRAFSGAFAPFMPSMIKRSGGAVSSFSEGLAGSERYICSSNSERVQICTVNPYLSK